MKKEELRELIEEIVNDVLNEREEMKKGIVFEGSIELEDNTLDESTTYYANNFCIAVNGDVGGKFATYPYFKFYRAGNYTKPSRISMNLPITYVEHQGYVLTLNTKMRKLLHTIMKSKPTMNAFSHCKTVWEATVEAYILEAKLDKNEADRFRDTHKDIPDFSKEIIMPLGKYNEERMR